MNGRNDFEGRLEICFGGIWGTVCDDSWDTRDAEVVCRQLGHHATGAQALRRGIFGEGSGPIYFDEVDCSGSEQGLVFCLHLGEHDCSHREDAGVRCPAGGEKSEIWY